MQHTCEIIHLVTGGNPLQIIADAVAKSGPREDSTRIGSSGVVRRQAVDVSPLRRVNQVRTQRHMEEACTVRDLHGSVVYQAADRARCLLVLPPSRPSTSSPRALATPLSATSSRSPSAWLMSSSTPPTITRYAATERDRQQDAWGTGDTGVEIDR